MACDILSSQKGVGAVINLLNFYEDSIVLETFLWSGLSFFKQLLKLVDAAKCPICCEPSASKIHSKFVVLLFWPQTCIWFSKMNMLSSKTIILQDNNYFIGSQTYWFGVSNCVNAMISSVWPLETKMNQTLIKSTHIFFSRICTDCVFFKMAAILFMPQCADCPMFIWENVSNVSSCLFGATPLSFFLFMQYS